MIEYAEGEEEESNKVDERLTPIEFTPDERVKVLRDVDGTSTATSAQHGARNTLDDKSVFCFFSPVDSNDELNE